MGGEEQVPRLLHTETVVLEDLAGEHDMLCVKKTGLGASSKFEGTSPPAEIYLVVRTAQDPWFKQQREQTAEMGELKPSMTTEEESGVKAASTYHCGQAGTGSGGHA